MKEYTHKNYKYDWKNKKPYPYYDDVNDEEYLKDRDELFKKHGNGWWCFQGTRYNSDLKRKKCRKKRQTNKC